MFVNTRILGTYCAHCGAHGGANAARRHVVKTASASACRCTRQAVDRRRLCGCATHVDITPSDLAYEQYLGSAAKCCADVWTLSTRARARRYARGPTPWTVLAAALSLGGSGAVVQCRGQASPYLLSLVPYLLSLVVPAWCPHQLTANAFAVRYHAQAAAEGPRPSRSSSQAMSGSLPLGRAEQSAVLQSRVTLLYGSRPLWGIRAVAGSAADGSAQALWEAPSGPKQPRESVQ